MNYGKDYARKVFDLIPDANFIAVDRASTAWWFEMKPTFDLRDGVWWFAWRARRQGAPFRFGASSGVLGEVTKHGDWRRTVISRDAVGTKTRAVYGKDFARKAFKLIPEANFIAVIKGGIAWWSGREPTLYSEDAEWGALWCGGSLGKVTRYRNWRETLISRKDIEGKGKGESQ